MEAISPTPTEPRDDSPDSNKMQIIKHIENVDKDIERCESSIKMMRKKADELEAASVLKVDQEGEEGAPGEEEARNRNQSLPQMIYAANKVSH